MLQLPILPGLPGPRAFEASRPIIAVATAQIEIKNLAEVRGDSRSDFPHFDATAQQFFQRRRAFSRNSARTIRSK